MSKPKSKNLNIDYVLTADGYNKLKADVERLERELKEIGIKKGEAAGPSSDWHDNPAYEELDGQERALLQKLSSLKEKLVAAKVVDLPPHSDTVEIGTTVKILILENNKEQVFTITDPEMTNPTENKISYHSPVGSKLMGKKSNEIVDLPIGKVKILSVNIN